VKRSMFGVLLILTFVAVGIAAAPPLTFKYSDPKANKTAMETDTYGVNNAGAIAGDYLDSAGVQHGMVLAGKKLTTIDNKKCSSGISFYGINKAGVLAGWCTNATGFPIAFTWAKGKFTTIAAPKGKQGTEASGINDKGVVVGLYFDSAAVQHGFIKTGTKYQTIDVKGATSTAAWGINNAGLVTIQALNSSGAFDAYTYNTTTKKLKKVNVKSATTSIIHGINNKGDLVYTFADSAGAQHGALLHAGKFYTLDHPHADGVSGTRADGINDTLVIVGRYSPADNSNHGFKAVTTP
jgi:uncharacterized membrane protein